MSTSVELICNARWQAPRFDAPASVYVTHVCTLALDHVDADHHCSCGASTPSEASAS